MKEEEKTASWIVLPDSAKDKPGKGKVIAVWDGKITEEGKRAPMDVKEWDVVYFTKYAPDEIEFSDGKEKKKYLVIRHSSVLAKESK